MRYQPSKEELEEANLTNKPNAWPYTFNLDPKLLTKAGQLVASSRKTIPTSFNMPWSDVFSPSGTTSFRAVDYEEILLFVIPTLVAPLYPDRVRIPLLGIVKAAALTLQNELDSSDIQFIEE